MHTFDEIRDALAEQAADLTDAQRAELLALLGVSGAHTDDTGSNGPGPKK